MSTARDTADRMRPFLQEMERSINAARQRRLNGRTTSPTTPPVLPDPPSEALLPDEEAPRLRARPKRATGFPQSLGDPDYRSQAG